MLNTSGSRSATDTPSIRGTGWYKPHMQAANISLTWGFGAGPKRDPGFEYGPAN